MVKFSSTSRIAVTNKMTKHNILLLAWLAYSLCCCQFVLSFSAPNKSNCRSREITVLGVESDEEAELDSKSNCRSREITVLGVESDEEAEVDRRRFLVTSVIGAASVLTVSEKAAATTDDKSSNLVASAAADVPARIDTKAIFNKAAKKAMGGGKAGAAAAVVQVLSLMWLRTAMNYQYRYGGTLGSSLKELYGDGGLPRLYQGLPFAIVQGPLTRFGDTAANVGILALLESIPETASLPLPLKTLAGSVTAGVWRICLMPIDTSKTAMQVEGAIGLEKLKQKVIDVGPSPLFQGALASAAATSAGHFPWYLTYNFMNDYLPVISREDDLLLFLVRSAALGLISSSVSDTVSNSLRVIKTTKQTAGLREDEGTDISYREALSLVIETDGIVGLFGRGLQTRLLTNAIQGAVFSVLWKYFQASM